MARRESKSTMSGHQRMPLLRMATREEVDACKEYKSGASYTGQILDNKKTGHGLFIWPNGARYEGEYCDNIRTGKGKQTFEDGTIYDGHFENDFRHGPGHIIWPNGESYEGTFFKDRRHGYGTYRWPNKSSYTGTFYIDRKEGYGTFKFADGSSFQGLYKGDERFGPGVHTHKDGTQDVGLWHREKLIRLCTEASGAFTMANHGEFEYSAEDQKMYIYPEYLQNRTDVIETIVNPPDEFQYPPQVDIREKSSEQIFSEALDMRSMAVDIHAYDESFFDEALQSRLSHYPNKSATNAKRNESAKSNLSSAKSRSKKSVRIMDGKSSGDTLTPAQPGSKPGSAKSQKSQRTNSAKSVLSIVDDGGDDNDDAVLAWNKTPFCVVMQKHVLRHQPSEKNVELDVVKICSGDRSGFGAPGVMEQDALELLQAAMTGDVNHVSDLLIQARVHVDVADKNGHTALLGASVNWHEDVINCLLDNGADVNKLNDEGVSALAACHVHFYSIDRFKYNIAEKEMDPPPDFERESGYDVNEAVKGIYSSKKRPGSTDRKPTHEEKLENAKITELRKEYGGLNKSKEFGVADQTGESILSKDGNKQLGTLKFKRAVRINVDDILAVDNSDPPETDRDSILFGRYGGEFDSDASDDRSTDFGPDEFASQTSVRNYKIEVSNELIERCATALSTNNMVVDRARSAKSDPSSLGTVRRLAIHKNMHAVMETTIRLLLRRGADPNASSVPMPVLFFAVKAGDVDAVRLLLLKGASTKAFLPEKKGRLAPLHIAAALPGEEGVQICELLLNSLADPDIRALPDNSFLNTNLDWESDEEEEELRHLMSSACTTAPTTPLPDWESDEEEEELRHLMSSACTTAPTTPLPEEEWTKDSITEESRAISGGRTPLHIACARDDHYRHACKVVHLLLDHHANPNLLCNGHSPMALAVASGNDLAIDELLAYLADPCLVLTHGVGSVLCIASSTEYEHRRTPENRLKLIDKLVKAGADILAPIPIGPKRLMGTAVDYSYYMYNLDRRIAHMPYHALTHAERETYNNRRKLLAHMGDILRTKAVERERIKMIEESHIGDHSRSPSPNFVYMGSGQELPPGMSKSPKIPGRAVMNSDGKVSFTTRHREDNDARKPLFRYCYECGRAVGVRLSACTRCKEVYYCSKVCKVKAWNARHKEECIRVGGQGESPDKNRVDSPTPQTDAEKGKPTTVKDIIKGDQRVKLPKLSDAAPNLFSSSKFGGENKGARGHGLSSQFHSNPKAAHAHFSRNVSKSLGNGKTLELMASVKVDDHLKLTGPMRGVLKVPFKGRSMSAGKNKKQAGTMIDPLTGLVKVIDPATGKVILMDNYSFV